MKKLLLPVMGATLCMNPLITQADERKKETVIVISFDGMRQDVTENYMESGVMPNMQKLREQGVWAGEPETITPSLTAPSHAAMSTGAKPAKTGVVSNQFHDPEKKFNNKDDAFHTTLDVAPIWSVASQQGKTTATVAFPGANPETKNQSADYTVFYGDTWAKSSLDKLSFQPASGWSGSIESFSPLKEAEWPLKLKGAENQKLVVLAADTTDDSTVNYDQFFVSETKEKTGMNEPVTANEWGTVPLQVKGESAGFSFKIKQKPSDLTRPVPVFRTAVTSGILEGPAGFKEAITDEFGFFPVESEDKAFEEKWITRTEYEEISARFTTWITDVSLYIKQTYKPDALFFYGPQIDHEAHHYTMTDPRQTGYTKEKASLYDSYVKWAYKLADETVGKTMQAMDEQDHLFVVSDHGMEAAHTMLEPNAVLKQAGLLAVTKKGNIDYSKTKAYAVPSGSVAHVYIHAQSTEKNGIVPDEEFDDVQRQVIEAFKKSNVALSNQNQILELAIEAVLSEKEEDLLSRLPEATMKDVWKAGINKSIHPYHVMYSSSNPEEKALGHEHAGDILLIGAPGYMMANGTERGVKPAEELGTHGGDSTKQDLRPVFMASGSAMKEGETIGKTSTIDLAPTLYELLEIDSPNFVEGEILDELWK